MRFERAQGVLYDGLYTFLVRLGKIAITAGLAILTARVLGPAGRGTYALPGVEAALVASAFGGLGSATSYFLLNRRLGTGFLRPVFFCALILTAAAAAAVIPLTFLLGQRWVAVPAILVLPSFALLNVAAGYAVGVKQVRYSTTIATSQTLLTICAMAIAFFWMSKTPQTAIAAWICGTTAAGFIALAYVGIDARKRLTGSGHVGFAEYWRFCLKVSIVNLISLLNYRADLYIVALFLTPAALGMYSIAVAGAESLLVPTQVAALVTSPHIGGIDVSRAGLLTARCIRNNLLIALVVCGVLFAFARPIITLIYGASFAPLVPAFNILLIGVFALSLGSPIATYFTLKLGRPEVALWLASLAAAVCIGSSLLLIRQYGMVGAAIGSTAGYAIGQGAALWYFGRCSSLGLRAMLVPTAEDFSVYGSFVVRLLKDGRRLLRPVH